MDKTEFDQLPPNEKDATLRFFGTSAEHEMAQYNNALETVSRLEDKLDKMKAYAKLIVSDTEQALSNAKAEVEAAEKRWNVAKGLCRLFASDDLSVTVESNDNPVDGE